MNTINLTVLFECFLCGLTVCFTACSYLSNKAKQEQREVDSPERPSWNLAPKTEPSPGVSEKDEKGGCRDRRRGSSKEKAPRVSAGKSDFVCANNV